MYELGAKDMAHGMPRVERIEQICKGCTLGKQHRTPFPRATGFRAEERLELTHGDLCGPISPTTPGGNRYFLLVVDDCSRYMWLEALRSKDEALKFFKKIRALAENEFGLKLKAFRSNRGGEFNSGLFTDFCSEVGIKRYTTAPYSPQQNGVVERRNQTVVEMARCMLKSMRMPSIFWAEAVKTAVHILNRSPTRSLNNVTPYEAWHKRKPNLCYLRTFGCVVHVKNTGPGVKKLDDRSTPMIFVGYEDGSKAYHVYNPATQRVYVSRDVIFEEDKPWNWQAGAGTPEQPEEFTVVYSDEPVHGEVHSQAAADTGSMTDAAVSPARSTSTTENGATAGEIMPEAGVNSEMTGGSSTTAERETADPIHPMQTRSRDGIFKPNPKYTDNDYDYSGLCLLAAEEPASVDEALEDPVWKKAMQEEMDSIIGNHTWEISALPAGHRAIGLKWVFKVKRDPAGNVVKHKARLVAKGYAQCQGVDFEEVFAPVARMEIVRLLLALAAHSGWQIHHMDVKSAFLNGDLAEEVYVQQPVGFTEAGSEHKVLRLRKALYGLRQAPRAWNAKLDATLISLGFEKCPLDHALYRRGDVDSYLLVGVYVDNLVITGTSREDIAAFKSQMQEMFRMSDLGLLSYYLGIEVKQEVGKILLCQGSYAEKILEAAGMSGCNPSHTPAETKSKIGRRNGGEAVDATLYRSVISSLRYLVNSRPDIAFAVGIASRFMEAPGRQHWGLVKQILRYVRGTIGYGCVYRATAIEPKLVGYSDSDHAGDVDERKSTSGTLFFLGSSAVTWTSQKQKVVAISSCEAEYVAASSAACQGLWLSRLLAEMRGTEPEKFQLRVDNKSAIALCMNPVYHDRSKHIEVRHHFIRECVETGKMDVEHVRTEIQLADVLTKGLGRVKFIEMRQKLGVEEVKMMPQD
uniref:Uncharacterized protein n=1 Tax=Avena sativa TaxID=4498 RepID=A0ACD6A2Q2_AVESA